MLFRVDNCNMLILNIKGVSDIYFDLLGLLELLLQFQLQTAVLTFVSWIITVKQTWSKPMVKGGAPSPRDSHSCNTVGTSLFVFGGTDGKTPLQDLYILDTSNSFSTSFHVDLGYIVLSVHPKICLCFFCSHKYLVQTTSWGWWTCPQRRSQCSSHWSCPFPLWRVWKGFGWVWRGLFQWSLHAWYRCVGSKINSCRNMDYPWYDWDS